MPRDSAAAVAPGTATCHARGRRRPAGARRPGGSGPRPVPGGRSRGPPSGTISAALDVIGQQDDPRWCPRVYALFSRVDPAAQLPNRTSGSRRSSSCSVTATVRGVIAALAKAAGTKWGGGPARAEHAPGWPCRSSARGCSPTSRSIAPRSPPSWRSSPSRGAGGNCWGHWRRRTTRRRRPTPGRPCWSRGRGGREGGARLGRADENEVGSYLEIGGRRLGPFYTFGELALKNRASWIRYEMEKLHDRVMKVRDVIPPEPSGRGPGGRSGDADGWTWARCSSFVSRVLRLRMAYSTGRSAWRFGSDPIRSWLQSSKRSSSAASSSVRQLRSSPGRALGWCCAGRRRRAC